MGKKSNPRWLWHGIDHRSGKVLAYVFGTRKDEVFLQLKALLEPFGISQFYTDGWGATSGYLEVEKHKIGKQNTQKIESKHTNLRAKIKRLARKTICFSKSEFMHELVIGIFINRYEAWSSTLVLYQHLYNILKLILKHKNANQKENLYLEKAITSKENAIY